LSLVLIKKALEKKLLQLDAVIETAYESVSFKPTSGVPYQRVQLLPRAPNNPTMGSNHYREIGEFQVLLAYPSNNGTLDVLTKAESIQQHFARGTTITESSINVIITRTPQIAGAQVVGDRVLVPVIIKYLVDVL
jgi:hypothetical protein